MTNTWEAYFIFSEKEKKGVLVLGVILTLSILISVLMPHKKLALEKGHNGTSSNFRLFTFDPNTIDSSSALLLGIPVKQVRTLIHYRNKGGRFYKAEDIHKIFGLEPTLAKRLLPFIKLNPNGKMKMNHEMNTLTKQWNNPLYWTIDINTNDVKEWQSKTNLPDNIIQQIFNYKNHLGGFSKVTQLKKVYGLSDSAFQDLRLHLKVQPHYKVILHSSHMNFEQWKSLDIFEEQQIFKILKIRKQQGGQIYWRQLVLLFDLTEKQALSLKSKISISD